MDSSGSVRVEKELWDWLLKFKNIYLIYKMNLINKQYIDAHDCNENTLYVVDANYLGEEIDYKNSILAGD